MQSTTLFSLEGDRGAPSHFLPDVTRGVEVATASVTTATTPCLRELQWDKFIFSESLLSCGNKNESNQYMVRPPCNTRMVQCLQNTPTKHSKVHFTFASGLVCCKHVMRSCCTRHTAPTTDVCLVLQHSLTVASGKKSTVSQTGAGTSSIHICDKQDLLTVLQMFVLFFYAAC